MKLYMTEKEFKELETLQEETDQLLELAETTEQKQQLSLLAASVSGLMMSPLLPTGGLRISLMVGLAAGGVLGCVYWSWWFAFAWLAAATFSPWIVGMTAYLAGCFVRGYRGDD